MCNEQAGLERSLFINHSYYHQIFRINASQSDFRIKIALSFLLYLWVLSGAVIDLMLLISKLCFFLIALFAPIIPGTNSEEQKTFSKILSAYIGFET